MKVNTIMPVAFFVALTSFAAHGDAIIENGDFEAGPAKWYVPGDSWKIVEGAGRHQSKALVWENEDAKRFSFSFHPVKVEPLSRYRFSVWTKVERRTSEKMSIDLSIEYKDSMGKWLTADHGFAVIDNDPSTEGWIRYEGITRPVPENAATANLLVYPNRGITGKVKFDDAEFERIPDVPIVYLQCSAYRNSFCDEDGDIRFASMLRINTCKAPLDAHVCEIEFRNAVGAIEKRKITPTDANGVEVTIPAKSFALGRQSVVMRLKRRGDVIGEVSRAIEKTSSPVKRHISIDASRRVVMDGKRFFPLGLYAYKPDEKAPEYWKGSPFNFAVQYGGVTPEELDRWQDAGVYICSDVRPRIYGYSHGDMKSKYTTLDESKAAFQKLYSEIGSHPAFFGWYLVDEATVKMIPNITAVNEYLQELDPDHPTYTVTDKPQDVREFLPAYDAIGVDPYPIGGWMPKHEICSTWAEECDLGTFGFRPMWHVPQFFNWAWYRKETVGTPGDHTPTRLEMANMTWQGIAAGANGICAYGFGPARKHLGDEKFASVWEDMCAVGREVKSMEKILLSDDIPHGVKDVPRSLVIRGYSYRGKTVLLVVNRLDKPVKASLELENRFSDYRLGLGAGVELKNGRLEVDFSAFGYAIIALD